MFVLSVHLFLVHCAEPRCANHIFTDATSIKVTSLWCSHVWGMTLLEKRLGGSFALKDCALLVTNLHRPCKMLCKTLFYNKIDVILNNSYYLAIF